MVLANMLSVLALLHEIMWLESKTVSVLTRRNAKIECSAYRKLLSTSRLLQVIKYLIYLSPFVCDVFSSCVFSLEAISS